MKVKLSENERLVLNALVLDGRRSCTEISKDVGISSQAVGKIQDKLEKLGVIKGYETKVNYDKLGVGVFAVALFRFKSGSWTRLEKEYIEKKMTGPHMIKVYRFSEGETTHMILYGFRNLKELDNYFHIIQTEKGHISDLKKLYVFSSTSILKDSPQELISKILDEWDEEKPARPEPPVDDLD